MNFKKAILLANVFITTLILWMVGSILFTWASNFNTKSNIKETKSNTIQPPAKAAVLTKDLKDFELIVKKDMFNTPEDTSGAAAVTRDGGKNERTSANLKLRGTIVGQNNTSYAIIFDGSTGKEDLYELNDSIQGAHIQKILADRVILNFNGREETLLLPVENTGAPRSAYRPPRKVKRPPKKKLPSPPKPSVK